MRHLILATLIAASAASLAAQSLPTSPKSLGRAVATALCDDCGTVQTVQQEKRKGKGGLAGKAGGAVLGGLLGNQIGSGSGNTVATIGGAVAGGVIGNEVQKKMSSKTVWVTTVKMRDGSLRKFEQEAQPGWGAGNVVRTDGGVLRPR